MTSSSSGETSPLPLREGSANISAPIPRPTQNPPNPFPAWRLRDGVKNATDNELELAVESCEQWGWVCAGLLILGLIAELALAVAHHPYDSFWARWGSVLATLLVVVGVAGEVQFGRMGSRRQSELQRRSGERLTEALDRASNAERELIAFRTSRRVILSGKESLITEKVKPFAGTHFDTGLSANSGEQADFVWDLVPTLTAAGWRHCPWSLTSVGGQVVNQAHMVSGSVAAANVEIHLHPDWEAALLPAAAALESALNDIGIAAAIVPYNTINAAPYAIHVLVGEKR